MLRAEESTAVLANLSVTVGKSLTFYVPAVTRWAASILASDLKKIFGLSAPDGYSFEQLRIADGSSIAEIGQLAQQSALGKSRLYSGKV